MLGIDKMGKFQFWLPTNLTRIQKRAVDSRKPIFLSGVPGTGKTVISIKRLQNSDNSIIFTYGKLLKKTIEEKLKNDVNKPVDNIHNWMWNAQDEGNQVGFKRFTSDENLEDSIKKLKSKGIKYDQILVDEGQDLSINTYKILAELTQSLSISADDAQQINNKEHATNEQEIIKYFSHLRKFELDEIFRSAYELYTFAIQFVPNNARAHNTALIEKLKIDNSGADKPYVYLLSNLNSMYAEIRNIINENPQDNIGMFFEKIHQVEQFKKEFKKDYELSTYHSIQKVVPSELKNIILTTFKSAKGIEFDIVIIPYFEDVARDVKEEYYVGVTRAKNEVHFLSIGNMPNIIKDFDKDSYELIDRRG